MKKQVLLFLALVAVLVTLPLLAGCQQATGSKPAAPEAEGKKGGKLILGSYYGEVALDPGTTTYNSDIMIHLNLFEVLYRVNKDGSGLEPSAASSHEVSPDGKVWTFHLRKDLKFSDGSPLKAEDVVYSIQRSMNPDAVDAWLWEEAGLTPENVEAPDEYTVKFTLSKPFVPFLSYVAGYWAEIFPKKALEEQGQAFFDKPICSGPFMVKEFVQADHLTLVRNPHSIYQPYLDEVEIVLLPDDNTRMLKLQSGDIDVATNVPFNQIDAIDAMPGLTVMKYPFAYSAVMYLNHTKPPLDDLNFRMALNYAVDREALIKSVLFGHAEVWTSVLPKGCMYWDATIKGYPYDLEKAKEYLAKSKYKDGAEFEMWTTQGNVTGVEVCTALQGMWEKLPGVKPKIVQYEAGVFREKRNKGEHTMFFGGFSSDVVDPDEILGWFLVGYVRDTFTFADVSTLRPLVSQAQTEQDPEKRRALYSQIQQWSQDNAYTIGLYYQTNNWGMKDTVKDFWVDPIMGMRLHEAWIEKK